VELVPERLFLFLVLYSGTTHAAFMFEMFFPGHDLFVFLYEKIDSLMILWCFSSAFPTLI
jgi:hypothetical protein